MIQNSWDLSNGVRFFMKNREDNDMIDNRVWSMTKMKLNYHDQLDRLQSMTKTSQNNDMTDCVSVVYA